MTEPSSHPEEQIHRRRFWLVAKSLLASLYFALMFFVLSPAAVLYFTRMEPWVLSGPWTSIAGTLVIVVANLWVARLVSEFIRTGDGTHVPIDPPRRFVVGDAYRWTRNPMYTAYVLIVLGEALLFGSLALVIYAGALCLIAHLYVVYREEPLLEARFGDEYRDFCRRVPRWGL